MTPRRRVMFKVLWMAVLITVVVLFTVVDHVFIYQAF
jgi:hypothetical protein